MTTGLVENMYPAMVSTEPSRAYSLHERRQSYSNEHPPSYNYSHSRTPLELPRPLEPRPTLQSSFSEASIPQRRQDSFRGPANPQHNLPGLRDILTPAPQASAHSSYAPPWNNGPTPISNQQNGEGFYNLAGLHPPLALYPPTEPHHRTQTPHSRSYEVPILETSPVSKQPPSSLSVSPYTRYPEAQREYIDARNDKQNQTSVGTYVTNGVVSPYAQSGYEYRAPLGSLDRTNNTIYPSTGAEGQQKYVGLKEVPGEGAFHVYESGHRIPAYVDGEYVNPQWGLTKANKPRKRLALACLDCREKKIKCEPGGASCLQCEKAKRPCRRAPAHQSQPDTAATPTWTGTAASPVRKTASTSDPTPAPIRDTEPDPLNKRRTREDPSPTNVPKKKHRSVSPVPAAQNEHSQPKAGGSLEGPTAVSPMLCSPVITQRTMLTWEEDPMAVEPEITQQLMDLYFAHVNNAAYCMHPRSHILRWLKGPTAKCQNERMVLYAMLAAASIFADDGLSFFGRQCARIVQDAVATQVGKFNISLAQSKLLLTMYHFSRGSNNVAWDYLGSAVRTITHMQLNTEEGCLDDESSMAQPRVEFYFSKEQLAECKRRTFWTAFFIDKFQHPTHCLIKSADVFVRLPCTDSMYEESVPSDAPYFNNDIIDPVLALLTPASPLSPMGWLAVVIATWGDVCDFMFRIPYRPLQSYPDAYESFYSDTCNRLQGWSTRLPDFLQYNEANLDRSIQQGYAGTFVTMHILSHFALLRLNRCIRHALMRDSVPRNIRAAHHHAHQILQIMTALHAARREISAPAAGQPTMFTFSTPFAGFATLTAVDVVSGGALDSNLGATVSEVEGGLACLLELSKYWSSAKEQLRVCQKRLYQIQNVVSRPNTARSGCWLQRKWGVESPLERGWGAEFDCIYGLGDSNEARDIYYGAFKEDNEHAKTTGGLGLRLV